jgi:hypothetical protein
LRVVSSDFDGLIAEVAGQTDADAELVRLELLGAIRQIRSQALKYEAERLVASGLRTEVEKARWREIYAVAGRFAQRGGRGSWESPVTRGGSFSVRNLSVFHLNLFRLCL